MWNMEGVFVQQHLSLQQQQQHVYFHHLNSSIRVPLKEVAKSNLYIG